jgi:hypothetical protein
MEADTFVHCLEHSSRVVMFGYRRPYRLTGTVETRRKVPTNTSITSRNQTSDRPVQTEIVLCKPGIYTPIFFAFLHQPHSMSVTLEKVSARLVVRAGCAGLLARIFHENLISAFAFALVLANAQPGSESLLAAYFSCTHCAHSRGNQPDSPTSLPRVRQTLLERRARASW